MERIDLPSGAVLEVDLLSYEKGWKVMQKLSKAFESLDIDLKGVDFKKLSEQDVLRFKNPICHLLADDKILEATKECFTKCLYNNQRIDSSTFDSKEARKDFVFAAFHALRCNLEPFFEGLVSSL
jgi:hypothetical protein